jgi:hypothetical protein
MLKEYLLNRARKKALASLIAELEKHRIKLDKLDTTSFIDLFNTGLYINLKTAGMKLLDFTAAVLKKERLKRENKEKNP